MKICEIKRITIRDLKKDHWYLGNTGILQFYLKWLGNSEGFWWYLKDGPGTVLLGKGFRDDSLYQFYPCGRPTDAPENL